MNTPLWPVRMPVASVGLSKSCFLFSLAFCCLLFLLIPALQPPARLVDLPQPRPQVRPDQVRWPHHAEVPAGAASSESSHSSMELSRSLEVQRTTSWTEVKNENQSPKRGTDYTKGSKGDVAPVLRSQLSDKLELSDIFIAVKTTRKYHKSRLELLIQTWVSRAKKQVSGFRGAGLLIWTDPLLTRLICY